MKTFPKPLTAKEEKEYPVSYTHLDVYKRQVISVGAFHFRTKQSDFVVIVKGSFIDTI